MSLEDTFMISNFDVSEATEVIRECAAWDDIAADPELADLIARDLAVDGMVRPADLQVVCFALSGALSTARYRSEGGAAGLRSRFIKTVIDITGDAVLTRTVLRALCDIPNNKKAPEPMTAEAIAEQARAGVPGPRATTAAVTSVLEALEQARVVVALDDTAPGGGRSSTITSSSQSSSRPRSRRAAASRRRPAWHTSSPSRESCRAARSPYRSCR